MRVKFKVLGAGLAGRIAEGRDAPLPPGCSLWSGARSALCPSPAQSRVIIQTPRFSLGAAHTVVFTYVVNLCLSLRPGQSPLRTRMRLPASSSAPHLLPALWPCRSVHQAALRCGAFLAVPSSLPRRLVTRPVLGRAPRLPVSTWPPAVVGHGHSFFWDTPPFFSGPSLCRAGLSLPDGTPASQRQGFGPPFGAAPGAPRAKAWPLLAAQ